MNSIGEVAGPVMPANGCRSACATYVGHAARHRGQRFGEFDACEVGAEAVVDVTTECQHGGSIFAGDIEPVRIGVHSRISVGCSGVGNNERARRDCDTGDFDILDWHTHRVENDGGVAHHFVHGALALQRAPLAPILLRIGVHR